MTGRGAMAQHIRNGAMTGLVLCLGAPVVLAQTTGDPAPPRLTFEVSSSLSHDDNPDLDPAGSEALTTLDNRFGLHLNTATRVQSLAFSLEGLARIGSDDALTLRDPSAELAYQLEGANSRLSFTGLYRESPVDVFEPVIGPDGSVSPTDVLASTGRITTRTAGFSFETGLQAPLGFDLSGNYSARAYSDTTDPDVFDSTTSSLQAAAHLRLAAGDTLSLTARSTASDYENATETERRGTEFSLGYDRDLRPGLSLQASLGQSDNTTRMLGVVTDQSNGLTGSLGLEQALPNGTASVTLSSARDSQGARQTLSFGRSMALPLGTLAATAGISARSGEAAALVGSLTYAHNLPADSFTVSLSREVTLNADDADVANTALELSYSHKINDVSDFGLSLDFLATSSAGSGTVEEATRQTLSATYSHDLTADWRLTAGYELRSLDRSSTAAASSNSVFLTVSRNFTLLR
jgi:hypothetical protein